MKYRLYFFALFILCSGFSCGGDDPGTITTDPRSNTYTIVFMDKTASTAKYDPIQKEKHVNHLKNTVINLKKPGDYLKLFYIDSHTRDGQNQLNNNIIDFTIKVDEGKGARTQAKNENDFYKKVSNLQQNLREQLSQHFNAKNDKAREHNTDLWDVLYLISKESENANEADKIEVLIFSDMVESIKGIERRDFHTKPLKDTQEAIKFANADFPKIKEHLAIDKIQNPNQVTIKLFFPNSSLGRANIQKYWETIFTKFGMKVISTN